MRRREERASFRKYDGTFRVCGFFAKQGGTADISLFVLDRASVRDFFIKEK